MFPELEEQRVKLGEFVRERLGMGAHSKLKSIARSPRHYFFI